MRRLILIILFFISLNVHDQELSHKVSDKQLKCLATNIYHEARGEPIEGQLAVALVTKNRAVNKTICEVVYSPNQFSWTKNIASIKDSNAWITSNKVAYTAMTNEYDFKATHYHNDTVNPRWKLTKVANIGRHVFYN